MQTVAQLSPPRVGVQAALGGRPSRQAVVQAFLRVKNQDIAATMDFDAPTGVDTTWQRIFCCLRSGYTQEALEVHLEDPVC